MNHHMALSTPSRTNHEKHRTSRNREADVRLTKLIRTITESVVERGTIIRLLY